MRYSRDVPQNEFSMSLAKARKPGLYNYLTTLGLLSSSQFGFRKSHSTATALLECTNKWYVNFDRKLFNLVVFIDLKKAFDTVDHQILFKKLQHYGIKGQAHSLLKSYKS